MIERTFQNISDDKIQETDQQSLLTSMGWSRGMTWGDLLQSKRVLIVSEAGAGKTYECRAQAQRLWDAGEPAFFIELAALATESPRDLLDPNEGARLDAWLASQSDIATFFLDSIDELNLSAGSFEHALKRLSKHISSHLHRARIVITTRPVPFDAQLVRRILPVPPEQPTESLAETFVKIAMHEQQKQRNNNESPPKWLSVELLPLSDEQILEFSHSQKVNDPDELLESLKRRNALEFARRPQDLIELCADWREHNRIHTHQEQVKTSIRIKLLPRDERPEPADLTNDKAIEGAKRLALAMLMTRRLTIRHNAASDNIHHEAALDPKIVLSDWQPREQKALLERSLFGFASYGRVRFHHRSAVEYLAAEQLYSLRQKGMPFKALKRLLFAETKGKLIARPSKRPIAGWLALKERGIFELLRDNEPAVLFVEGDPESLTPDQRTQALRAYAEHYGSGGWRGLHVPAIQAHRFASKELADVINCVWHSGIENPDVREVFISIIEAGRIDACADIVYHIATDTNSPFIERILALDALAALDDKRLDEIVTAIAEAEQSWADDRLLRAAIIHLFPKHMSTAQLFQTLRLVMPEKSRVGDLSWQLPRLIATTPALDHTALVELRNALVKLISEGLKWQEEWPHITSDQAHLSGALAATCQRGLDIALDEDWLHACVLALRTHHRDNDDDEPIKLLREHLGQLTAEKVARLFWVEDAFLQSLHRIEDPWKRLAEITFRNGVVQLKPDRDLVWIIRALSDTERNVDDRAMLLEAAIHLSPDISTRKQHIEGLKCKVLDDPCLTSRVDTILQPPKNENRYQRWEKEDLKRKERRDRKKSKQRASWMQFWQEVANQPENAFSPQQSHNTAWNLWQAMSNLGDNSRSSGWNRRFIEKNFSIETADRLRHVLMTIWRNDQPTFPSERPENERNSFLVRWQLGLAAIYAEAEDPDWAKKLNYAEAQLATRYTQVELNGLPQWIESLVVAHPKAVDQALGKELSWDLSQTPDTHGYSSLLNGIAHASEKVAKLFLPRLESWLDSDGDLKGQADNSYGMAERIRQITQLILKYGDDAATAKIKEIATQRVAQHQLLTLRTVWLSTLMQADPSMGIDMLEKQINTIEPSERSEAVAWLANLFGDRRGAINLSDERFTPKLLLRLLRLAYQHVRVQDDVQHEGVFTPDTRDDAERARNQIVSALLNIRGEDGWAAKLEMANDPLCKHFKDRILAEAEESWAQEIDADVLNEEQAKTLNQKYEAPITTNEAMFTIMKDRLSDLEELLLSDTSPREEWADIKLERVMRRAIARALSNAANLIYTVDQEAVTADEKETDIRLRSTTSNHEAVIELKLGDGRSAKELRDTIANQLARKYMAGENSRSGALLVTLAGKCKWDHPDERRKIDAKELLILLSTEAERVQQSLCGRASIAVHLLDLRPRLPPESQRKLRAS